MSKMNQPTNKQLILAKKFEHRDKVRDFKKKLQKELEEYCESIGHDWSDEWKVNFKTFQTYRICLSCGKQELRNNH